MFSILHIVQTSKEDCKDFILAALILIVELIKLDLTEKFRRIKRFTEYSPKNVTLALYKTSFHTLFGKFTQKEIRKFLDLYLLTKFNSSLISGVPICSTVS